MIFYSGGIIDDPNTIGYSFVLNKFSDLGRLRSYDGQLNLISFFLFNISLIIVGCSIIPFAIAFATFLHSKDERSKWINFGKWSGIIAGINFAGVGLTPRDLLLILHHITQYIAFLCVFIMCIIYGFFLFKNKYKLNGVIFLLCSLFQLIYLTILFHIIPSSRIIDCISQKIIVYIQLVIFVIQTILLKKIK